MTPLTGDSVLLSPAVKALGNFGFKLLSCQPQSRPSPKTIQNHHKGITSVLAKSLKYRSSSGSFGKSTFWILQSTWLRDKPWWEKNVWQQSYESSLQLQVPKVSCSDPTVLRCQSISTCPFLKIGVVCLLAFLKEYPNELSEPPCGTGLSNRAVASASSAASSRRCSASGPGPGDILWSSLIKLQGHIGLTPSLPSALLCIWSRFTEAFHGKDHCALPCQKWQGK